MCQTSDPVPVSGVLAKHTDLLTRNISSQVQQTEEDILTLLLPKDSADDKGVILEVRAGTGGEEAALFASDLFNMYQRFSEQLRWKFEVHMLTAPITSKAAHPNHKACN